MSNQKEKIKVPCSKCGKTLFFYSAEDGQDNQKCSTVEIKCRNRECKEVNLIKICGTICK